MKFLVVIDRDEDGAWVVECPYHTRLRESRSVEGRGRCKCQRCDQGLPGSQGGTRNAPDSGSALSARAQSA